MDRCVRSIRNRLVERFAIAFIVVGASVVSGVSSGQESPYEFDPPMNEPLSEPLVVPEPVDPYADPPTPDASLGTGSDMGVGGFSAAAVVAATAAGRTRGSFAVSSSGAATYRIPIWTPPMVGSLEFDLALVYNSRSGNGPLGIGWSIPSLSAITRCNKTWAQDGGAPAGVTNTTADRFCLDGQQLKLVSGTTYATEIESFSKVVASGTTGSGPTSFTVTTKNGLIYEYGTTVDSRVFAGSTGTIRTWALSKVRDRASATGNSIGFTYTNEAQNGSYTNGTYRIASIKYPTTATSQGPFYEITFQYSNRPTTDIPSGYLVGNLVKETKQLDLISVKDYSTSALIKSYALSYNQGSATSRLRLTTVQECSASNCLEPTTIAYQSGTKGWSTTVNSAGVSSSGASGVGPIPLDLNSDGLTDLVYPVVATSSTSRWWATIATSAGFGQAIDTGVTTANSDREFVAAFSGKGQDQLLMAQSGTWRVVAYNGTNFTSTSTGVPVNGEYAAVDYDGDGLPDLAAIVGSEIRVRRNTTVPPGAVSFSATSEAVVTTAPSLPVVTGGVSLTSFPDWNGDGRADLFFSIYVNTPIGGPIVYWYPVRSNGFGAPASVLAVDGSHGEFLPMAADWNDDGCTDIVSGWRIYISDCAGRFSSLTPSGPTTAGAVMTADWDRDGRIDLLYTNTSNSTWYVQRSTGEGIATGVSTGTPAPTTTAWFVFDQNGDGLVDLGIRDGNDGNELKYQLHAGPAVAADLATSFTDGFGMNQSPTYKPLTAAGIYTKQTTATFPLIDYVGPLFVVNQFTASTGAGTSYQNQFYYYHARVNVQGRGFAGFAIRRTYDTRNGLYTFDYFDQLFPFTGTQNRRLVRQTDNSTPISDWTADPASATLGTSVQQRSFVYIDSSTEKRYEFGGSQDGALIAQINTDNTFNTSNGNLTDVATTITDKDASSPYFNQVWSSSVSTTYSNSTTNNCYLPDGSTTTNSAPGQAAQVRTVSYVPNLTRCRITSQTIEPGDTAQQVATTLGYDGCGNLNSISVVGQQPTGPSTWGAMPARTTSANYGTRCQLPVSVTDAMGKVTGLGYHYDFGVPEHVTDPNNLTTSWLIDDFGRRTKEMRPDNTKTVWSYESCTDDPCWGVDYLRLLVREAEQDTAGTPFRDRKLFYDGFERLKYDQFDRVLGVWTVGRTFIYDALGRVTHDYQPRAHGVPHNGYVHYDYDPLNRPTMVRLYRAGGMWDRTTTLAYEGRQTKRTDPLGRVWEQVTDVMGRTRQVIDPMPGGTTSYDYDVFGNLNRIEDAIGAESTGIYNLRGFRTEWTDADRGKWTFKGNSLNELAEQTNAKSQKTSFVYDNLGRMTSRTEPEGISEFEFGSLASEHNIGRLKRATGLGYTENLTYGSKGRLSKRSIVTDQTYDYDYTYNSISALDTLTYPTSPVPAGQTGSRFKIQYGYSFGAPISITDITQAPTTTRTLWTLTDANDASLVTAETLGPSVVSATAAYDATTNEILSLTAGAAPSTINRQNLVYGWDVNGNLIYRQDVPQNKMENFVHDELNRVESSTLNGTTNLMLSYDESGNLQQKIDGSTTLNYTYGTASRKHQATQIGTDAYTYDANGNVATRGGQTQTWASFDLPTTLQNSTYNSQFAYGPDHQRWRQIATYVNGTETTHYVGGLLEKQDVDPGETYWRHYVPTPSGNSIIVLRNSDNTTSTTYALTDHLGNNTTLLNETGDHRLRASYTAFGARRGSNWNLSTVPDWANIADTTRRGFTGHEHLDNITMIHMNGRVYDPTTARFWSIDPIIGDLTDSQSVHPYAYVGNRPLSFVDPFGLSADDPDGPDGPDVPGGPNGPDFGDPGYDGPGSWDWWGDIFEGIGDFLGFGSDPPPPPPAASLPGISAQNGVGMCGPGSSSAACSGLALSVDGLVPAATLAANDYSLVGCDELCEFQRLRAQQLETVDEAAGALSTMGDVVEAMMPIPGLPLIKGAGFVAKGGIWTSTKGRTAVQNAFRHWQAHRNEFPELQNAKQYVQYANAFTRSPPVGTLTRVRANGDTVFYHPDSNIFVVTDAKGTVRTMFKPDPGTHGYPTNLEYFNDQ